MVFKCWLQYKLNQECVRPKSSEFILISIIRSTYFFDFNLELFYRSQIQRIRSNRYMRENLLFCLPLKTRNLKSTWSDLVLCMFKNKCTMKLFSRNRKREKKRIHTFVTCSVKWIHNWKLRLCRWKRERNATRFY